MTDVAVQDIQGLAQKQYFKRPPDQRFEDLATLKAKVASRRNRSLVTDEQVDTFQFAKMDGDVVVMTKRDVGIPSHYSFGQAAALVGAPAEYLRRLGKAGHDDLVVKNLNTALAIRDKTVKNGDVKVMLVNPEVGDGYATLQALTSPTYGRIWDIDVVENVERILDQHPEFHNPLEWGGKRGGLYASDRDIFLFYIDGGSVVDGGADLLNGGDRDQLHRGFMVGNSEVGAGTLFIAAFLFRMVCGNHNIFGIEGVKLLKIRHTSGGPARFVTEAMPALQEYVTASAKPVETAIRAAKQFVLPTEPKELETFFKAKGFSAAETRRAKTFAEQEEGGSGTLWQMIQGYTRSARDMAFIDARMDLDRRAGKLLDLVKVDTVAA